MYFVLRATGVVRRIDDLGRIVIPKEIRRTMRIREGAPLEVYVNKGDIVLKRYAPLNTLEDHAQEYTESLQENLQCIALVCDESGVLAIAGASKSTYLNKPIGEEIEQAINSMKTVIQKESGEYEIIEGVKHEHASFVIAPVKDKNQAIGAVVLLSKGNQKFSEVELKLAELAANFLGSRMTQSQRVNS